MQLSEVLGIPGFRGLALWPFIMPCGPARSGICAMCGKLRRALASAPPAPLVTVFISDLARTEVEMAGKKKRNKVRIKSGCVTTAIIMALVAIPVACVVWAVFVEPYWIQITRHKVVVDNYPSTLAPITIVQMTDQHCGPYIGANDIRRTVYMSNAQSPDIVVLTGDFVSRTAANAGFCAEALSGLKSRKGVYFILGNHDYSEGSETVTAALVDKGFVPITNTSRQVFPGVYLIGIDDFWNGRPDVTRAFAGVPPGRVNLVISHSPKIFPEINDRDCTVFVGHTHGGQVVIPFIPRNKIIGLRGWKYISGWYQEGNSRMYVNRGIGMVSPPVRFGVRPEISVFTVGGPEETSPPGQNHLKDGLARWLAFYRFTHGRIRYHDE